MEHLSLVSKSKRSFQILHLSVVKLDAYMKVIYSREEMASITSSVSADENFLLS